MAQVQGKLLLYWDYELQSGADQARSGNESWGEEDYHQTVRLLDLLDEYRVRSTFACLGFAALPGELPYHSPDQIKEIASRGHEIASHSWKHEWLASLNYDKLTQVLKQSKEQLEGIIDQEVISFAPPWNVPTRFIRKSALGLYDWRGSQPPHTDIPGLCRALHDSGFKTTRIDYEPLTTTIKRRLFKNIPIKPIMPQWIEGVLCFRVNGNGFGERSLRLIQHVADNGGFAVIYAHPHSLVAHNNQRLELFLLFMETVNRLRQSGNLEPTTPGEIYLAGK